MLRGLCAGNTIICTECTTGKFTVGREYKVTSHLNIVDDRKKRYHVDPVLNIRSKFILKTTAAAITIATTITTGGNKMDNIANAIGMTLDGATVKRANGATVIEKPFSFAELKRDMQVFDTLLNKWRIVKTVGMFSFDAGNSTKIDNYTDAGKLDPRHTVVAIDRMRIKVKDVATVEKLVTNKVPTMTWVSGEKNYYVVFKATENKYSVFSGDVLRRIDTLFFSRDNAFKVKKQLNTLLGLDK